MAGMVYHDDVTFTDPTGDAQVLTFTLLAGNLTTDETLPSEQCRHGICAGDKWTERA